jgi:hypothetical protein
MSPDQNCIRVGVFLHGFFQAPSQILFKRRVLDNRHMQRIMKPQHPLFAPPFRDPFDLLHVADLKTGFLPVQLLHEQRYEYCPLAMCVYGTESSTLESR